MTDASISADPQLSVLQALKRSSEENRVLLNQCMALMADIPCGKRSAPVDDLPPPKRHKSGAMLQHKKIMADIERMLRSKDQSTQTTSRQASAAECAICFNAYQDQLATFSGCVHSCCRACSRQLEIVGEEKEEAYEVGVRVELEEVWFTRKIYKCPLCRGLGTRKIIKL